jgi:CheY-like chemotaxis protein
MEFRPKVLIAEDESIIAMDLSNMLSGMGFEVTSIVNNALEVIQKTEEEKPDIILMDILLVGFLDGIEAAKIISYKHNTPVIYITALKDEQTMRRANVYEDYQYIVKPFKENELRYAINKMLALN